MRRFTGCCTAIVTTVATLLLLHPTRSDALPTKGVVAGSVPSVSSQEAYVWAQGMAVVARIISTRYVLPISESKLLTAALTAMHETAGIALPDRYQGKLEQYLERQEEPELELLRARMALGNPAVIKGDNGIRIGIEAMLSLLDPHSVFLTQEELRFGSYESSLGQTGITLEDKLGAGPLLIRLVALGSPAHDAGLLPGDEILSIQDKDMAAIPSVRARSWLVGQPRGKVKLVVQPFQQIAPREVELTLARMEEDTVLGVQRIGPRQWRYVLDPALGIGYLRITYVRTNSRVNDEDEITVESLHRVLRQLENSGLRGLVLDLRECGGGYLSETDKTISLFIREGIIRRTQERGKEDKNEYVVPGMHLDVPLVALIGPDTSGAGELIAAALQDNKRAILVGERTRGKGSIQQLIERSSSDGTFWPYPGTGLRLTSGFFLRPNGLPIHKLAAARASDPWGVQPDPGLELITSADLRRTIRRWRHQQDMRQPNDFRILPLDDLSKDPVLSLGLEQLQKRLKSELSQ